MNTEAEANSPASEKDLGKDLKTHEAQSAKIKELELLQHQVEKATGRENLALNKAIKEKDKITGA